ncbi:MAG: phage holin family protein [Microbacteriaceae bacterium]
MSVDQSPRRSLFKLIGDLPGFLVDLVKSELELLKKELTDKLKLAGVGIGLLVVAASVAFFALAVFIAAAVLGLSEVLPGWVSALIVGGALLLIAALLVLAGVTSLKRSNPPTPQNTIASVKKDVDAITGSGKRGSE